jgi:hypothetical protein
MPEIVVFVLLFISAQFGPHILGAETLAECERTRAELVADVKIKAPQIGDAVYIGECQKAVLRTMPGGKDA